MLELLILIAKIISFVVLATLAIAAIRWFGEKFLGVK